MISGESSTLLAASAELLWRGFGGSARFRWAAHLIALTFGPTKTAAAVRDLTLGPATVALLRDHIATHGLGTDGLLFHIDGQPISRQRAGHMWRAATAGMPRSAHGY